MKRKLFWIVVAGYFASACGYLVIFRRVRDRAGLIRELRRRFWCKRTGLRARLLASFSLSLAEECSDARLVVRVARDMVRCGHSQLLRQTKFQCSVFEAAVWLSDHHLARHSALSIGRSGVLSERERLRLEAVYDWRFRQSLPEPSAKIILDPRLPVAYHFVGMGFFVRGVAAESLHNSDDAVRFFNESLRFLGPCAEEEYAHQAVQNLGKVTFANPGEGAQ